jgi:hypothetical protein
MHDQTSAISLAPPLLADLIKPGVIVIDKRKKIYLKKLLFQRTMTAFSLKVPRLFATPTNRVMMM